MLLRLTSMCAVIFATAANCLGAPQSVSVGQLAVDVVTLRTGKALRGAVVEQRPDSSILMVVSRPWLEQQDPDRYAEILADSLETQADCWQTTSTRIAARLKAPLESPRLKFFLEQEQQRLSRLLRADKPLLPDFFWLELRQAEIARVLRATPDRQRVGVMAWYAELANVETRSVAALKKELVGLDFALDTALPDLGPRLPARRQDELEWEARLAVVEYSQSEAVDFQGTGNALVRVGEGNAVDWQAILPGLLEQQTRSLLQELSGVPGTMREEPDAWLQPAQEQCSKLNVRGFRATRVQTNSGAEKVTVESRFVARLGIDDWRTIWQASISADSLEPRLELEDRIAADPQVRTILRTVQTLGIGADDVIQRAIRHGAATMDAQAAVDAEFYRFRDRYLQRLDAPYLPLPAKP